MAILLVAVLAGACSHQLDSAPTADAELTARLIDAPDRPAFAFSYRALGTQVLECFLPHRRFFAEVDTRSGLLAVTTGSTPTPSVIRVGASVLLRDSLFADRAIPASWLELRTPATGPARAAAERILGPDLAGYVFGENLPDSGTVIARAAASGALDVSRLPRGAGADGYRIRVDPSAIPSAENTRVPASPPTDVTVDLWVDDTDAVTRLEVRPGPTGTFDGTAAGWSLEFRRIDAPIQPEAGDSINIDDVGLDRLRPAPIPNCELGP